MALARVFLGRRAAAFVRAHLQVVLGGLRCLRCGPGCAHVSTSVSLCEWFTRTRGNVHPDL